MFLYAARYNIHNQNCIRLYMNSKSLLEIFNEKQLQLLKTKMWWVADRDKPYLLKFSLDDDDNYVLLCSLYII